MSADRGRAAKDAEIAKSERHAIDYGFGCGMIVGALWMAWGHWPYQLPTVIALGVAYSANAMRREVRRIKTDAALTRLQRSDQ